MRRRIARSLVCSRTFLMQPDPQFRIVRGRHALRRLTNGGTCSGLGSGPSDLLEWFRQNYLERSQPAWTAIRRMWGLVVFPFLEVDGRAHPSPPMKRRAIVT